MATKKQVTTVILVGEADSGLNRLAHLLIGDASNGDKKRMERAMKVKQTPRKKILLVDTSRMSAPGGRGYRIVEPPPCDEIMSSPDARVLSQFFAELESIQRLNSAILVFRSEDSEIKKCHWDFLNVLRSIYGLDVVNNVLIAFTGWPVDSASIESRRKAGISQEDMTSKISEAINKRFGTNTKHVSFVMDAFEKASSPGAGDSEVSRRAMHRDQELRRLLLAASHMNQYVPIARVQLAADKKLLQECCDGCLADWNEARTYLVDDLFRECDMSKDRYLQRQGRLMKSKIDQCDKVLEGEYTVDVKLGALHGTAFAEMVEDRIITALRLNTVRNRQIALSQRWTQILGFMADISSHVKQRGTIEGLSPTQQDSMMQTLSLARAMIEDLYAEALKCCEPDSNNN